MKFSIIFLLALACYPPLLGMVKEKTVSNPRETVLQFAAKKDVEIKAGETTYLDCLDADIREKIKKNYIDAHSHYFMQLHPPTFKKIGAGATFMTATPECDRIVMVYPKGATLFDCATGRTHIFPLQGKTAGYAAISSDGKWVLMTTKEPNEQEPGPAILWDLRQLPKDATGEDFVNCIASQVLMGHTGVGMIEFSANGKRAVTCAIDMTLKVWDLSSPGSPKCFPLPGNLATSAARKLGLDVPDDRNILSPVTSVSFSPDANYLLLGYEDGTVKLCNVSKLEHIKTDELEGHIGLPIVSSSFSTNGHFCFTASIESAILWDLRTPIADDAGYKGYRVNDRARCEAFYNSFFMQLFPPVESVFAPIESVTTLPIVGASSLVNNSTQTIFYNLETLPRGVSRLNSHYCPPSSKSCSLTANNRWGIFLSIHGETYLVDFLNRHSYKLRDRVKEFDASRNYCAIISSDGRRAVTCTKEVLIWNLCPSESLSFEQILVLAANVHNPLESRLSPSLSAAAAENPNPRSGEEGPQMDAATEETVVSAALNDDHARRSIERVRKYMFGLP